MRDRLNSALFTAQRSSIRQFSALAKKTPGCLALTLGEPDFSTPPSICSRVGDAFAHGETHYIENAGRADLRQAIVSFENRRRGTDYTADEVIVTAGATQALFTALFGILEPDDEVIVPTPAFLLYQEITGLCRGKFIPMDTSADDFQITAENLSRHISDKTKAIILNSPNNPTGCVYDQESIQAVYQAVRHRKIFVICDDVYDQLVYQGPVPHLCAFPELREKLLLVQSFSKPYAMTGWRMGYLLADRSIMERLELLHQYMVVSTPAPFQDACIEALSCDIDPMLRVYAERRALVLRRLKEIGLPFSVPQGAFYVFPQIAQLGLDSQTFCIRMIQEAGLAATPGFCFGSDSHIRLSYCCSDTTLRQGLDRLERFVASLR